MVVRMDSCTQLTEGTENSDTGPKGSEAINMRSRLRSRNNAGNNVSSDVSTNASASVTSNSIRKVTKRNNPSTGITDGNVKSSSPCSNASNKCDVTEESICKSGWPLILDYCKDECKRMLREYELCAYEQIVRVFRAQGNLTDEKRKFLHGLQQMLSISIERHQGEIRRATFDETLVTIAKQLNCQDESIVETDVTSGWVEEGRRLISLLPRLVPQTAFHTLANHVAVNQVHRNNSMPIPGDTGNPGRLVDTFSSQVTSISPKKIRMDSVSSTSLMMKNNTNNFKSSSNSQVNTVNIPSSKSKNCKKSPVTKVPSVAKATVTTNSGITTTHLAVVRKSVNNLIRHNSPGKSLANCDSCIDTLVTSPSKGKNIDLNTTGHSNVGQVIFVPSSTSSSSNSCESKNRLIKSSSQVSTLISRTDTNSSCKDVNSSSSSCLSSSNSSVKVVPVSSVTSPVKMTQSITVIPSSSNQRINLLTSSNGRMSITPCSPSSSNGIVSTSNSSTLPGKGVIIQTYARSTGAANNCNKKANLIIVPSSKSISTPLNTKGSITVSNTSSSSIIGKVVVPSTSVLVPSSTGLKRPLLTNDTDCSSSKKNRILQTTGKDTPKVITLQPNKSSTNPMSGRMIDVPGLTAEAVESLINGKMTPEIMKLVQSAVSASLAKDQVNCKQQVITCLPSSSKVVTSPTNCLTSTITVSKICPETANKQPIRTDTEPLDPLKSTTCQVDDKDTGKVASEKQPSSSVVKEIISHPSMPITCTKDDKLTEKTEATTASPLKPEKIDVLVKQEDSLDTHQQAVPNERDEPVVENIPQPPEPETKSPTKCIEKATTKGKMVDKPETEKESSTDVTASQPLQDNQADQSHSVSDSVHPVELVDESEKNENTPIVPVIDAQVECPRIQPIKLSRQGTSWVPYNSKSDESDAFNSDEDESDEEDEEAISIDQVEDDDDEGDNSAHEATTGEKDQQFTDDASNETGPRECKLNQQTSDSITDQSNSQQ